jgi:hypothetical protein
MCRVMETERSACLRTFGFTPTDTPCVGLLCVFVAWFTVSVLTTQTGLKCAWLSCVRLGHHRCLASMAYVSCDDDGAEGVPAHD